MLKNNIIRRKKILTLQSIIDLKDLRSKDLLDFVIQGTVPDESPLSPENGQSKVALLQLQASNLFGMSII